jgi:hypothetical protein
MSEQTSIREPKVLFKRVPGDDAVSKSQAANDSNLEGVLMIAQNLCDTVFDFKTPELAEEFFGTCSRCQRAERSENGLMTLLPIEQPEGKTLRVVTDGAFIAANRMLSKQDNATMELVMLNATVFVRTQDPSGVLREERLNLGETAIAADLLFKYCEPEVPSRAVAETQKFLADFNIKARATWRKHLAELPPPPPDPATLQGEILGAAIAAGIDRALARMNIKSQAPK